MQLTRYTDYSLRVLMYLGLHRDRLVTISEMAEIYGISRNHLVKVVHNLARARYIHTVRGKGGGMKLAHEPVDINVGEVVRRTEKGLEIIDCAALNCRLEPACRLKTALDRARDAFVEVLDGYSLADLLIERDALAALLEPAAAPPPRRARQARSAAS
ncbi:MAG: Rrf2 family transcriptional regulator [Alphaproteobacteria bacterium]|nr:Rrf2 family transcriptional regulator [Alphaproteobacteria bacterium]